MWQYGNRQNHFYQFRITLDYKKILLFKTYKNEKNSFNIRNIGFVPFNKC